MKTTEQVLPPEVKRIQDLQAFMHRVEGRLELSISIQAQELDRLTSQFKRDILQYCNNQSILNQIIMENSVTVESLATQVRAVRNSQNKYFRIKKENKAEKQAALKASKAAESKLDKMVAFVLDKDLDFDR